MGTVRLQRDGPVARLTIDHPARLNAMSLVMWGQLADLVGEVGKDPELRVLLLRGSGTSAFVSGSDISGFDTQRNNPANVAAYAAAVERAQEALIASPVPSVACIQGVCMGGGIGLAVACDLRYSSRDARFRMPAARLGLAYSVKGVRRMVDVIGAAHAAEMFYTARTFDGSAAQQIGLVHHALDAADLDAAVEDVLQHIAANAPLTIRATKLAINAALGSVNACDPDRAINAINAINAASACFDSADYIEGRRAFIARRVPQFSGT